MDELNVLARDCILCGRNSRPPVPRRRPPDRHTTKNKHEWSNLMEQRPETIWAREAAVSAHHRGAEQLDQAYQMQTTQGAALAFRYGRAQIEVHFDRQVAALPLSAKILDVGCGPGHQMRRLRNKGFEVFGVEPAENMREIARSRLPAG